MAEKLRLAQTLADNIGLGIANLKLRESMRSLSIRDSLTGLFNRRYMEEALVQEEHRTKRNKAQLAVIMIDIDRALPGQVRRPRSGRHVRARGRGRSRAELAVRSTRCVRRNREHRLQASTFVTP